MYLQHLLNDSEVVVFSLLKSKINVVRIWAFVCSFDAQALLVQIHGAVVTRRNHQIN